MSPSNDRNGDKLVARTSAEVRAAPLSSLYVVTRHYPKYVAFLRDKLGVGFRGRILELGAGAAWFAAELSKLPKVVEIIATDFGPNPECAQAPQVFKALGARETKIKRRRAGSPRLNFPDRYFDFVVCAGGLQDAMNLLVLLREVHRVLKPGGQFIAVREPVKPLVGSRADRGLKSPLYSRADYQHLFERAGFSLELTRISLATGLKYYLEKMVNGLTHARYAFMAARLDQPPGKKRFPSREPWASGPPGAGARAPGKAQS